MKSEIEYGPQWKGYLYKLQDEAPKPMMVECNRNVEKPSYYGPECHGLISREAGEALCKYEGSYLIRESQNDRGRFTLVLRVLNVVKNFKLFYENGKHFVGEKKFDDIYSLAEDGLITMYVEGKAQHYIEKMNKDPVYFSLSRYSHNRRNNKHRHTSLNSNNGDSDMDSNGYYGDDGGAEMHMATYEPGVKYNSGTLQPLSSYTNGHVNSSDVFMQKREVVGALHKKHLTPTSSDERRNNKKKQRSLDEEQLFYNQLSRRSADSFSDGSSVTSQSTSSPRRTPVPYTLDSNDNPLPIKQHLSRSSAPSRGPTTVTMQNGEIFKYSNKDGGNSLDQIRQFCVQPEAHPNNKPLQRSKTSISSRPTSARQQSTPQNPIHYRQRSAPGQLMDLSAFRPNISERNTPPLSELDEYYDDGFACNKIPPVGAMRYKKSNVYCGSGGSCDSSLSNVSNLSTGSSALPPQTTEHKRQLDQISQISSEEGIGDVDRGSTPSPESTNQRRMMIDNMRCSPDIVRNGYQGNERSMNTNYSNRIHCSNSDNKIINSRHQEENYHENFGRSVSDASFALKRSPTYHGRDITRMEEQRERHKSSGDALPEFDEGGKFTQCRLTNKTPTQVQVTRRESFKQAQKAVSRSKSSPSPRKPKPAEHIQINHVMQNRGTISPRDYDKEHSFKRQTYHGLQWCEYCGNFMWGIVQQGVQCKDCGLNVHKQCSKLVPSDCQPALKHIKHVFAIDLTTLVKLHGTERPVVVDKCINEIEMRGITSDGLYRVSGYHEHCQEIKQDFDKCGSNVDLSSYDVDAISSALKLYLRELPVPLIPYTLYSRFINASKLSRTEEKLDAIRTALKQMPPAHLHTLVYIIRHLGRVCDYHNQNQMNSHNLGIVFGPTMLRTPEKDAITGLNDATYQQEIVETMIQFRNQLFGTVINTDV